MRLSLAAPAASLGMPENAGRLLLRRAATQEFVVYSKPPMAGPEQVHLARVRDYVNDPVRYVADHTRCSTSTF